ncbi:hypothetical protein BR93DRAFT_221664 [Coniochaeta sp. PMI_546]|nr:hypothetical protein BR93DRAFT_221664 [Coniochaeta sp. PMI_546]
MMNIRAWIHTICRNRAFLKRVYLFYFISLARHLYSAANECYVHDAMYPAGCRRGRAGLCPLCHVPSRLQKRQNRSTPFETLKLQFARVPMTGNSENGRVPIVWFVYCT